MLRFNPRFAEDPKVDLLIRLTLAGPLILVGMVILVQGLRAGGFGAVGSLLMAVACFIAAGLVLAPWIAERVGNLAGCLLFPDRKFDRPQPVFSLAEGKRSQGQPQEALAEYERILLDYPAELRCFIGMMDIAARDLRDPRLAEGFYRRGCEQITEREQRQRLQEARNEILRDFPAVAPAADR